VNALTVKCTSRVRQLLLAALLLPAAQDEGVLALRVTENGKPVPFRIHLRAPSGKPVQPPGHPFWKDHFDADGQVRLSLPVGEYSAEIERGPEFESASRTFKVGADGGRETVVELNRLVSLAAEGWWSGDLHVHRPTPDVELLLKAEDLHVAPVITWWNARDPWKGKEIPPEHVLRVDGERYYSTTAGEDEREGGALMYYGLTKPLPIQGASREYPSPVKFLMEAKVDRRVHIDLEKPFWWDTPTWIATGQIDTIGIAVNHFCRSTMSETEAWGRPRPADRLPPPLGVGYWVQEIYYHVLDAGLRIPPSAGSASGVLPNPVGYNRVYVHVDGELTWEKWWGGLRSGRSFVTNGPLLRVTANGELPGHVFRAEKPITVELAARLDGRDPVEAIEIVHNGGVERSVPAKDPLGKIEFASSGWFLVRCIAKNEKTFRFASTAPFYVEIGGQPDRISRTSAQFFIDWIDERMARVPRLLKDPEQLEEVLKWHRQAREFWLRRVKVATAD
jgi:hypothetical protein